MKKRILFAGDFYLTEEYSNKELISNDLVDLFQEADFRLINLESPVTESGKSNVLKKSGPNLKTSRQAISRVLKLLNIDMVTLANNHILDFGERGVKDTLQNCEKLNIKYVGAALNLEEAKKYPVINVNDVNLAILNFAENEWASATSNSAGANPLSVIDNVREIKEAKKKADKVIVIIHGGHEYYYYPSPRMVKQYRFYAENGADIIVGHHSHCIGGYEIYNEVPIFYGLGNFLFTKTFNVSKYYPGIILELFISKKNGFQFKIHPIKEASDFNISLLKGNEKTEALNKISEINNVIISEKQLLSKWERFCDSRLDSCLFSLTPLQGVNNRLIKSALRKLKVHRLFFNKKNTLQILNRIRCEAHHDIMLEVFKKQVQNKL